MDFTFHQKWWFSNEKLPLASIPVSENIDHAELKLFTNNISITIIQQTAGETNADDSSEKSKAKN